MKTKLTHTKAKVSEASPSKDDFVVKKKKGAKPQRFRTFFHLLPYFS